MEEEWKIISHNPNYEISNMGQIRNKMNGFILKQTIHGLNRGMAYPYYRVELKSPRKKYLVHRLVAEAFIPNPENLTQINHKDNNGFNNKTMNIEWCDHNYNIRYSQLKRVIQKNEKGDFIKEHESLTNAALTTNSDYRLISAVCLGKRKLHNGFKWEYKNEKDLLTKRRGNGRTFNGNASALRTKRSLWHQ